MVTNKPKRKSAKSRKYAPKVRLPISFDKAVAGILGLSQEDAKRVREAGKERR